MYEKKRGKVTESVLCEDGDRTETLIRLDPTPEIIYSIPVAVRIDVGETVKVEAEPWGDPAKKTKRVRKLDVIREGKTVFSVERRPTYRMRGLEPIPGYPY